jgi:hypothetical protein
VSIDTSGGSVHVARNLARTLTVLESESDAETLDVYSLARIQLVQLVVRVLCVFIARSAFDELVGEPTLFCPRAVFAHDLSS